MSNGNSSAKDRPSVGRILQQARIDAKLTVDEVSSSTRVRIPIVHAIEQDDFSRCGGDVYARGHIRALARAVGADPDELIELYNGQQHPEPQPLSSGPLFEAERIRPEPRRPNWTAAMVAAIVVVVTFVGFTFFTGSEEDEDPGTVAEGASTETPTPGERTEAPPREEGGAEAPDPSESAVAAVPSDKVTVRATADGGSSWVSAKDSNGRLLFEGVIEEGDSQTFTDDEQIDLVLGNAGVVQLHVNGRAIEDEFESGQVERLSYTPGDPSEG
ncbi:helix-turn-helix domain-containing protein [Streptomyces marincola]|uniref:Cytoskeleton protein RodZ-like C-terminal domain-containing protein n=1 Tax=Streptomyces marincola TaxID=2878388 RepID=A0A1W7CTU0_9ACTN|nr:helix-turn-helix domain-containing protein [Streptomyces marincola]ARQ68155.1 hypothetical protein CAG99_04245 [Streptomyces marincola]